MHIHALSSSEVKAGGLTCWGWGLSWGQSPLRLRSPAAPPYPRGSPPHGTTAPSGTPDHTLGSLKIESMVVCWYWSPNVHLFSSCICSLFPWGHWKQVEGYGRVSSWVGYRDYVHQKPHHLEKTSPCQIRWCPECLYWCHEQQISSGRETRQSILHANIIIVPWAVWRD